TTHQLHTLLFCLGEQLLGKLLVIHIDRHRFECFGHHQSFPPSSRPACQTKTRSTVIQTVPTVGMPRRLSFDVVEGSGRIYVQSMAGEPGRGLSGANDDDDSVLVAVVGWHGAVS